MKNKFKNIIPVFSIAAVVAASSVPVMAEYKLNYYNTASIETENKNDFISANSVKIDDEVLKDVKTQKTNQGLMLPLRAIAEELGYSIDWNAENMSIIMTKGPQYIKFDVNKDGYTFAKTAPLKLGKTPEFINGSTYVPVEFFSNILNLNVETNSKNAVIIKTEQKEEDSEQETVFNAEILSIENGLVLVNDFAKGEINLNINNDTEILNEDGSKAEMDDLKMGNILSIKYGDAMTFSIPPMNNPVKIIIKSEYYKTGKVKFIENINDGQIMADDSEIGNVVLNITEDVEIIDKDGNKASLDKLKKDTEAKVTYGNVMTASLPPINTPIKIEIISENESDNSENELIINGVVKEFLTENMILVESTDNSPTNAMIALRINEDTKLLDKNNNSITMKDLSVGLKVSAKFSPIMTRSIPPQSNAFEIKVID